MNNTTKYVPEVGTPMFLQQRTGSYYVDLVKHPYTVIGYERGQLLIQEAKCIFPKERYYDTLPESIEEDKSGEILRLNWSRKHNTWQIDKYKTGYPEYARFGRYEYFPYLD